MPEKHGWDKDPEADDPFELIGSNAPGDPAQMARCIAEEFARLGKSRDQILSMFENPFYQSAHRLYRTCGEETITEVVDEVCGAFGGLTYRVEYPNSDQSNDAQEGCSSNGRST